MVPWHISFQRLSSVESSNRRGGGTGTVIRASATCAQAVYSSGTAHDVDLRHGWLHFWRFPFLTIEDDIFEVTATAGDAHLGTEDFDNQIVDVRMQDSKRWNRGKDLAGNDPAVRHGRTQCERAKRTLSFSTQVTIEIDALLDCTAFPVAFPKAWFKELNMDYLRTSKGPVERCLGDGGIDKRSVHDVVHVRGFLRSPVAQNVIQEFFFSQWEQIHQSRRSARFFCCWTLLRCSWSWRQLVV